MGESMNRTYDIIIPMFNQIKRTQKCIDSIYKHSTDFNLLLINNGGEKVDPGPSGLRIDLPTNLGFVQAVNIGLNISKSPYVIIQNNDTEVYPECYDRLRYHLDNNENCGVVGPVTSRNAKSWQNVGSMHLIPHWDGVGFEGCCGSHLNTANLLAYARNQKSIPCGMVAFFLSMFKREVIEKVGYLDSQFGLGFGDDDDYCERVKKAGYNIRCALDVYVFHNHRTTFKGLYNDEEIREMQAVNIEKFKDKWGLT
jgi:GT2 family glycosyltransferase